MAGDITSRTRFIGDATQLLATYRALGAQAEAFQRQINQVNSARLKTAGFQPIDWRDTKTFGTVARNTKTEVDALNKTFRTFSDTSIRTRKFGDVLAGTLEEVHGDFTKLLPAAEKFNTHMDTLARNTPKIREQARAFREYFIAQREAGNIIRDSRGRFLSPNKYASQQLRGTSLVTETKEAARIAALASKEIEAALASAPPLPAQFQQLQQVSPRLVNQLQQRGLGTTPQDLYAQNFRADVSKDLVKGTTQIRGTFNDLKNGIEQGFNAELDKSGKLVTRFGGHLSGLGNLLSQTVRNFQKVVLWGVATTAVFGTMALAVSQLQNLSQLDKNLKQLGITANLTNTQTHDLFGDLADIAYRTATPLDELTKSADDIALAVRGTGKSVAEYEKDILNLTEAVGIYTNLTGEDTVQATDLLVSSMKQLGLQTEDVTGLLSKITAVAGGQSTAISDITQGLAVMAEAARQAGLSVDETIAAVQVLGQVTAKSPSEIATAFKNLVGALDSRAGAKALGKFNIDLRDGAGNLRNILDIYTEISDKIRQGIIPADEVKGLVKAIAGGPRRAPDAAALLSNIDQIAASEQRAIKASNEALIVNAKVLDTVQAKITQVQVAFEKVAFEQFGEGFAGLVKNVADGLTALLKVVNSVPTSFITAALQAGLFLAGLRLGIGVMRFFVNQLREMYIGLKEVTGAFGAAAVASKTFNSSTSGPIGGGSPNKLSASGGRFDKVKNFVRSQNGLQIGIGAGVGAVAGGLSSGGDIKSILGGGLTGAGLALLTAPIPEPWHILAGAIAVAGGALVSFIDNGEKAAEASENAAQKADKLLNTFTRYDSAADTIDNLTKKQQDLAIGMAEINSHTEKSAQDLAVLQDNQRQYVDNIIAMTQANQELNTSLKELTEIDKNFANLVVNARAGRVSQETLQKAIREQQAKILQQTSPNVRLPNDEGIIPPSQLKGRIIPYEGSTIAKTAPTVQVVNAGKSGAIAQTVPGFDFDLTKLKEAGGAELVKDLFDKNHQLTAELPQTSEAFTLVSTALAELRAKGDPAAAAMEVVFNNMVAGKSAVDGLANAFTILDAKIASISIFDPKNGPQLAKLSGVAQQTKDLALQKGDTKTANEAYAQIAGLTQKAINGQSITKDDAQKILELNVQTMGLLSDKTIGTADKLLLLQQRAEAAGLEYEFLGKAARLALGLMDEDTIKLIEDMDEFTKGLQATASTNTADLQAQIQRGEFKGDPAGLKNANAEIDHWNAVAEAVGKANAAYETTAELLGTDINDAVQEASAGLTGITGLHDAQSLSAQQLIERLFSLADTYNLTGGAVDTLGNKIVGLMKTLQELSDIRARFGIEADVNISGAIKKLQLLHDSVVALGSPGGLGFSPYYGTGYKGMDDLQKQINALSKSQTEINNYNKVFTNLFKSQKNQIPNYSSKSTGSSGGGGGSGSTPKSFNDLYDVSNLDLPTEIANATNREALIQQAIKNARKLQSKIPGATTEGKNDIVELLKGTQRILEVRGVKDDLLRKALEELAEVEKKRLEFETKADTIRRIRVAGGSFAAIANVPLNSKTGVSVGGQNQVNVSLNVNGQILTPAQLSQFADLVAAAIKRQIAA